jgi:hypothetical protein
METSFPEQFKIKDEEQNFVLLLSHEDAFYEPHEK